MKVTVENVAEMIARHIHAHGQATIAETRRSTSSVYRPVFIDAVALAVRAGWLVFEDDRLKPGEAPPSSSRRTVGDYRSELEAKIAEQNQAAS